MSQDKSHHRNIYYECKEQTEVAISRFIITSTGNPADNHTGNQGGDAYSSQARAVVRIRTTQRTDQGLGGSVNISDIQTLRNGNNLLASNIKLDYRYKGLDVFIGGTYNMDYLHQYKYTLNQTTRTEQEFKLDGELNESARQARENINIGANYQFNDNHSAGIRFEKGFTSHRSWKTIMDNTAFVDGKL